MTAAVAKQKLRSLPRFKTYSAYKDSGVEWLGKIPAHWDVKRIKYVAPMTDERSYAVTSDLPYIGLEHIEPGTGRLVPASDSASMSGEEAVGATSLFRPGDVLFGKLRPYLAKVLKPEFDGHCSTELLVLRSAGEVMPSVLVYQLLSRDFIGWVDAMTYGAKMPRANPAQVMDIPVALASAREQGAIAAFLDQETARIDALVAKKERLIELLHEKRTALITRAVMKGLDPSIPVRNSGVEWLGEIPAHWQVKRLKFLVTEPLKYGANESAELTDPELPRYIRITDIQDDGTLRDDTFRSLPEEVAAPYFLTEGDLLFARSGATVGKTFRYDPSWGRAAHAGYLIRARLDERRANSSFVVFFTQSGAYWDWLLRSFIQATIQNMSAERYASLVIPVPPLAEQALIVERLRERIARLENLAERIRQAIQRLHELRAALVSAAVTGKIDVREAPTS